MVKDENIDFDKEVKKTFEKYKKVVDNLSVKEGFLMLFFLSALMIVVAGNFGVSD